MPAVAKQAVPSQAALQVSIVMPCLNEAATLPVCIGRARRLLESCNLNGEIVVSDNGSTDGSQEIAARLGARVVHCPVRGYGAALSCGIEQARGTFVIIGDSDDSYHFDEAAPMLEKLGQGFDVCMGTRLKGTIMPGAMPKLNRLLGNPVLTFMGRLFFDIKSSDFHCGMRAFRRDRILEIGLVTTGMEWASEQVIKSRLAGLRMTEVPVTLYKDGRDRPPHLRPWRDGWRHLRFMLLHAPNWLFIYPGGALFLVALILGSLLLRGTMQIGLANLDVHTLLTMAFCAVIGLQTVFTGVFANVYAHRVGILPSIPRLVARLQEFSLERLLLISLALGSLGFGWFFLTFWHWYRAGFPQLDYQITMRQVIPALTLVTIAVQGMFNGFLFSMLFLETKTSPGSTCGEKRN